MLRCVRIGPDKDQEDVGIVSSRCPDLLAIDNEVVAVGYRSGGQRGQVASSPRLAHPEGRRFLSPHDGHRPTFDLFVVTERHDGRADDAEPLRVETSGHVPSSEFL